MTSFGDENLGEALPVANDFGMQPSLRRLQPIQKSDPSTALGELKAKSLTAKRWPNGLTNCIFLAAMVQMRRTEELPETMQGGFGRIPNY